MELKQRILACFFRFGYIHLQSNHHKIQLSKPRCHRMMNRSNADQNKQNFATKSFKTIRILPINQTKLIGGAVC
jgi:hypothetical protein